MATRLALPLVLLSCIVVNAAARGELVERVLAVVDDDPILLSEVDRMLALGMVEAEPDEDQELLRRRILDQLVEQRLRFHEVERYGFASVPPESVDLQLESVRARFDSPEAFEERLELLGLDEDRLRHLLSRQLQVFTFVEERLGPRIFVGLGDIEGYYRTELVPQLEAAGELVPSLEEVREPIRAVLKQRRLNEELDRWTDELRLGAEILDYFDEHSRQLPPLAFRWTVEEPEGEPSAEDSETDEPETSE